MVITDIERQEWAQHPVTVELLEKLREAKEEAKDAWAQEAFTGETNEKTSLYNAAAIGGVRVLNNQIEYLTALRARGEGYNASR